MTPSFAVLIFEFNAYETEPLVEVKIKSGLKLGHREKSDRASVWLHVSSDEHWKKAIPLELEESCLRLFGPAKHENADRFLKQMQVRFDQLGVEHFELTCTDD